MDRLKTMKRVVHYIRTTNFSNANLQDCKEQMFIEDEYLQALIDRDNTISFLQEKIEVIIKL